MKIQLISSEITYFERFKTRFIFTALIAGVVFAIECFGANVRQEERPNVVFILIDDFGWRDTGVYGSPFYETPNIDRLAKQGVRFANAYAASPVCSPTRASIMTGKYPARLRITDWISGNPKSGVLARLLFEQQLPLAEFTIAEAFKEAGYKTGFIGKWHLGKDDFYPEKQGFDLNIAGNHRGAPNRSFFSPYNLENLTDGPDGEYLPDRLATEAIHFITQNKDAPFFLFLSHYTVHSPVQAKPEKIAKYKNKLALRRIVSKERFVAEGPDARNREVQDDPEFAAMIESMDENVGRVLEALETNGLAENTIVVFTSDNGGQSILLNSYREPWGSNRPLRAGKGWHYEGGIRVPLIVKWPGKGKMGTTIDTPVISNDFYPTLLEMAGLSLKPEQHLDGKSLAPLISGATQTLDREALFWHYPHYHGSGHRPSGAVRVGDFKLIEFFEDMRVELYDLRRDVSESNDLSESMPEKTVALRKMLHEWRKNVDAAMPEKAQNKQ